MGEAQVSEWGWGLYCGGRVEVLEPPELRERVADVIPARYPAEALAEWREP